MTSPTVSKIRVAVSELPNFKFKEPFCFILKIDKNGLISVNDRRYDIDYANCINTSDLLMRLDADCLVALKDKGYNGEECDRFLDRYLMEKGCPDGNCNLYGVNTIDKMDLKRLNAEQNSRISKIKENGCVLCPFLDNGECFRSVEFLEITDTEKIHKECPLGIKGAV